jgi:hypothetical protein
VRNGRRVNGKQRKKVRSMPGPESEELTLERQRAREIGKKKNREIVLILKIKINKKKKKKKKKKPLVLIMPHRQIIGWPLFSIFFLLTISERRHGALANVNLDLLNF